jgi:CheY-like chemotaxis protein
MNAHAALPLLIVEDDADVRETLVLVLESEGFEVRAARDGRDALDILHGGFRPRLILLDLMMPVMNGWEFRAEMKRDPQLAGIPVVFVSALEPAPDRAAALEAAGFLHKPFDLEALLETVDRVSHAAPTPAPA